jgi:hypothetical protein
MRKPGWRGFASAAMVEAGTLRLVVETSMPTDPTARTQ